MESRQRRSSIEKVRIDSLRVPPAGKAQRPFHQSKGDKLAGLDLPGAEGGRQICDL